jgi:hypothetical protein
MNRVPSPEQLKSCNEKGLQLKVRRSIFRQATMTTGFQQAFPVCEAFRESSWRYKGAGAMPAPYCLPKQL